MAYVITLKVPTMQIYVREPLVGGEFSREEWDARREPALESKADYEATNDRAFRETLLERPFLVCRKFTTGLRVVVFLDNVGLIEQIPDERARRVLEEIQRQVEAARESAGKKVPGAKVETPPFFGPGGRRIPGGY